MKNKKQKEMEKIYVSIEAFLYIGELTSLSFEEVFGFFCVRFNFRVLKIIKGQLV